jgi:hypothetical protein
MKRGSSIQRRIERCSSNACLEAVATMEAVPPQAVSAEAVPPQAVSAQAVSAIEAMSTSGLHESSLLDVPPVPAGPVDENPATSRRTLCSGYV